MKELDMIRRYAIFVGSLKAGKEEEFRRRVVEEARPIWLQMPGLIDLELQFTIDCDEGAPETPLILATVYEDVAAMDKAIASPQRNEAGAIAASILADCFVGDAFHYITQSAG